MMSLHSNREANTSFCSDFNVNTNIKIYQYLNLLWFEIIPSSNMKVLITNLGDFEDMVEALGYKFQRKEIKSSGECPWTRY